MPYVRAYESWDVDVLAALLTDDVCVSMPPVPLEYQGRDDVARFYASINHQGRTYDLVPTRANGQPAFGTYLRAPAGGVRHGAGLLVVTLTGDRICAMVRFDNSVLPIVRAAAIAARLIISSPSIFPNGPWFPRHAQIVSCRL
jgi:SnoaL-like domain